MIITVARNDVGRLEEVLRSVDGRLYWASDGRPLEARHIVTAHTSTPQELVADTDRWLREREAYAERVHREIAALKNRMGMSS